LQTDGKNEIVDGVTRWNCTGDVRIWTGEVC